MSSSNCKKAPLSQSDFAKVLSVGTINHSETAAKKIKDFGKDNSIPFKEIETALLARKE